MPRLRARSRLLETTSPAGRRETLVLPSILSPYATPCHLLPKPTPANLRRFDETPVVRRAINLIEDRVASMDWQIRLWRGYTTGVKDAMERA